MIRSRSPLASTATSRVLFHVTLGALLYSAWACDSQPPQPQAPAPASPTSAATGGTPAGASASSGTGGAGTLSPGFPLAGTSSNADNFAQPCMPCGQFGCFDCGSGCDCGEGSTEPQPWDSPFKNNGEPGFGKSKDSLCATPVDPLGLDIWSDERGVFALVSGPYLHQSTGPFDQPDIFPSEPKIDVEARVTARPQAKVSGLPAVDALALTQLWQHDGSGWKLGLNAFNAATNFGLQGAAGDWIAIHDRGDALPLGINSITGLPAVITSCTLGVLKGDALECFDLDPVRDIAIVKPNLAHALSGERRLLSFDGQRWRADAPLLPFPATRLWADETGVLAVGRNGTTMWFENGAWRTEDVGSIEHVTAVFGEDRSNLWAGTSGGALLQYDGTRWNERGRLGSDLCETHWAVIDVWGSGDQVFFASLTQLARWNGTQIETLGSWSCSPAGGGQQITGISGKGQDELFVSMIDRARVGTDRCAGVFVLHYDGKQFHRM